MFARNKNNAWVAGVAAGLADKHNISANIFRLLFVVSFFAFGLGLVMYWWYWIDETADTNQMQINF